MAPFLGKRKTEARVPWTFILLVHFQHNRTVSFFFVLLAVIPIWLGSPHLLYSYAGVSFSLSLKAVVSNKPSLVFFFKLFSYFKFPLPQSFVWISAFHLGHLILSISGMKTKEGFCCWCCSVLKSLLTLCNPMNCSTPGSLVLHYLWVCSDSCPLGQGCYLTTSSSAAPFSFCL